MFCLSQVLDSKYQGIFLQLAQGIQGFVFHQLAKGELAKGDCIDVD